MYKEYAFISKWSRKETQFHFEPVQLQACTHACTHIHMHMQYNLNMQTDYLKLPAQLIN